HLDHRPLDRHGAGGMDFNSAAAQSNAGPRHGQLDASARDNFHRAVDTDFLRTAHGKCIIGADADRSARSYGNLLGRAHGQVMLRADADLLVAAYGDLLIAAHRDLVVTADGFGVVHAGRIGAITLHRGGLVVVHGGVHVVLAVDD